MTKDLNLLDDETAARMIDEYNQESDQDELNVESLFLHDQKEFLQRLTEDVPEIYIREMLEALSDSDIIFWTKVLFQLINTYSLDILLNQTENFLQELDDSTKIEEIKQLVLDLKVKIRNLVKEGLVNEFTNGKDFEELLKDKDIKLGQYMLFVLKYSTGQGFRNFIRKCVEIHGS